MDETNKASIEDRLGAVRMLVLDADGVLTDGSVWISSSGEEMLCFNVRDGMGITRLIGAGIEVAILSGRDSNAVRHRAQALDIKSIRLGEVDKLKALKEMAGDAGCPPESIAYLGDDLADIGPMKTVGLAIAVADAAPEVVEAAHHKLAKPGGHGAVRELAEMILRGRGQWP